jgi:TctA family transporter
MLIRRGSLGVFVTRPISGKLLALVAGFFIWQAVAYVRQIRQRSAARLRTPQPVRVTGSRR